MKLRFLLLLLSISSLKAENYFYSPTNNPKGINYACRMMSAVNMVLKQPNYNIYAEHNGDDNLVAYAGSFSKTLEHDAVTGLLTANGQINYQRLLTAVNTGQQAAFNAIVQAPENTRKFVNPQASFARSLEGIPGMIAPLPPAPNLSSAQAAADMIEDYLMMICRDVRFSDYGTGAGTDADTVNGGSKTNNAAAILNALGDAYKGPKPVTAANIFRGNSVGDPVGPYISQLWWLPIHPFFQSVEQRQQLPVAQARQFGASLTDFTAIQNGVIPKPYNGSDFSGQRYIITGKDGGTSVHNDGPGEYEFYAVNILLYNGAPLSPASPYLNGSAPKEQGFITFMIGDMYRVVMACMEEAFKHCWAHKWLANRRLRPEAMAGLVNLAKVTATNPYNLDASLFATYVTPAGNVDLLAWVLATNHLQDPYYAQSTDTYLLNQLYPEGSPVHPSYPAGHATVAAACTTALKAFFDDTALLHTFLTPKKPSADGSTLVDLPVNEGAHLLTVAGELDKLASNVAISRNWAGVHYRSDGDESLLFGERIAIKVLQDHARIYHESGFTGFEITLRDGTRVRITPDAVTPIV
jgi:membrane-associated phospholipid phosphatase